MTDIGGAANPAVKAQVGGLPGSAPVSVEVAGLVKYFGNVKAIRSIDFRVEAGTSATLLGPSGCGKTTTLRCIAGLESPTEGRITIGNLVAYDSATATFVEPERRNIGMVFQSYAIWPHMTVGNNIGFPLRIAGIPKAQMHAMIDNILELVGLRELKNRSAADLSGGQQQRVALARALVHQPSIVLFDEPLSNLDTSLRERMRAELKLLQNQLKFTAIYVTHDQEEAMALSDHIIVMNKGTIEQQGKPQDVFKNPATAFAAHFLGYSNALSGEIVEFIRSGFVRVRCADGIELTAPWNHTDAPRKEDTVTVGFRADSVQLETSPGGTGDANRFVGQIEGVTFLGPRIEYVVRVGDTLLKIESSAEPMLVKGTPAHLSVARQHCCAFLDSTAAMSKDQSL